MVPPTFQKGDLAIYYKWFFSVSTMSVFKIYPKNMIDPFEWQSLTNGGGEAGAGAGVCQ